MGQLIAPFLILIAIGLAAVIYLLLRKKPEKADNSLLMLQQQLNHIAQVMDNKLSESNKAIFPLTRRAGAWERRTIIAPD